MQLLRQSTVATVYVGPVLDSAGAAVTTAVLGDFRLVKNGTPATLTGATVTHDANGYYTIALTTGNTDTTGRLDIGVGNAAMSMANHRFNVRLASVFDAMVVNATNATGGLPTATGSISALAGAISTFAGLGANAPANWINAAAIATDAIGADEIAAGAVTKIVTAIWDELTATIRVVGSYGERIAGNLNAQVSTRASQTSVDNVSNLITALNNLSAKMNIFGSPLLEIPDSGSTVYAFTVVVKDDEDKLVNLDASPTLAAANAAATDRSANLSAVSNPSTGRYTFTYTVANTHAKESLRITVSGAVSAEARYIEWIGAVVDYDTLTTLQDVQTRVIDLQTQVGTDGAGLTAIGDTRLANLDATVSSRASASALTTVDGKVDTLQSRITATLFSGITSLGDWLRRGFRKDSGTAGMITAETEINTGGTATFLGTTDSLEAIRDRGDAAWTGGGGGGGDPWVTSLPGDYEAGQAGFMLNAINNSISGGKITSTAPVTPEGVLNGPIVIGDDYLAADSRSFDWFIDPPSGVIGDFSCRFGGSAKGESGWLVAGTLSEVTVDGNPKWRLRFELPKAKTSTISPRLYNWSVELRKSGAEVTKKLGTVQALRRYTDGTIT